MRLDRLIISPKRALEPIFFIVFFKKDIGREHLRKV